LALELAVRYSISSCKGNTGNEGSTSQTLFPLLQIVPNARTRDLLQRNPQATLARLQLATMESDELARVTAYARDAHLACAWSHLCVGRTNDQVVDELNAWFGTSHSMATWANRRCRGTLLLHFPALAYQTVLPLDGTVLSMHRIAELIESLEQVTLLNGAIMEEYRTILGEEDYDNVSIPDESVGVANDIDDYHRQATLNRWGYQVLPIALHVDDSVVQAFHAIPKRKFHPIFNNADANSDANDLLRLQLDFDDDVSLSSEVFIEFRYH